MRIETLGLDPNARKLKNQAMKNVKSSINNVYDIHQSFFKKLAFRTIELIDNL